MVFYNYPWLCERPCDPGGAFELERAIGARNADALVAACVVEALEQALASDTELHAWNAEDLFEAAFCGSADYETLVRDHLLVVQVLSRLMAWLREVSIFEVGTPRYSGAPIFSFLHEALERLCERSHAA